jgi:TonB-linked SusC/RagA family outer membrane protein
VITLVGANRTATTDAEGRYALSNVAPGRVQLRAARIGYQSQLQILTVQAGASVIADFNIAAAVVSLDEVVITAVGEQRQRELGNAVAKVAAASVVEEAPVTALSDVLTARAPGVVVQRSSGQVGSGTRIRIRGANSVSLSNEPIVYVDGIRVESNPSSTSIGVGGQQPSRIDDINPEDIESIEIIKGPSAATLYGTEAANGVIRITTKRGVAGRTRWNVYLEQGVLTDPNEYPTNYRAFGTRPTGAVHNDCTLINVSLGQCTQDSILSYNVLEDPDRTVISTGWRSQYGMNVSGGTDRVSYFFSGEFERERGTYALPDTTLDSLMVVKGGRVPETQIHPNSLERVSLRTNVRSQLRNNADVTAAVGYTFSDLQQPQNDNNSLGILPSGYFGTWSPTVSGGWGFLQPHQSFAIDTRQAVERFTGSLSGDWQPFDFLFVRGAIGADVTSRLDDQYFPTGEVPSSTTALDGIRQANRAQIYQYTADFGASATARVLEGVTAKTSVGVQYFRDFFNRNDSYGNQLPAGARSVGAAATWRAGESTTERITLGVFAEEQIGWRDRLFLTGAVRADDNSAFGRNFEAIIYPKVSASWVISEESFFPRLGFLSSLRLRGAWGQTGLQPGSTDAIAFFDPVGISDNTGVDKVGITVGGVGNLVLEPERAAEFEGGVDVDLYTGRVGLAVTYFRKKSTGALIARVLAPSLGTAASRFENLGAVLNQGWEGVLNARVVDSRNLLWDFTVSGSTLHNELLTLGEGIEPIVFGIQQQKPGFPLGSFWQRPIRSVNDANGDGIIALSEVTLGDTSEFLGGILPKRELTVTTGITLFDRIRLHGLMDHKGGHLGDAGTKWFRCSQIQRCESAYLPNSDLQDQAAAVVARSQLTRAGYVASRSFWRFREAALTLIAPASWASALRAERASLTVTARNLFTITDWPDIDPESVSSNANFTGIEFLTQPPIRHWIARLNLTF